VTADIHALAGAYALDALDREERVFFEAHLAMCEACRAEVSEYHVTAAALAAAAEERPPAGMRARVLAGIDVTRQLSPLPVPTPARRPRPLLATVAAGLAVAVLGLSGLLVWQSQRIGDLERGAPDLAAEVEGMAALLAAPDQHAVQLSTANGGSARFVYSPSRNLGVLVGEELGDLPEDRVYQLWLFHDGTPVDAGTFSAVAGRSTAWATATVTGAQVVAVTVEPAPGVPQPTGPVVLSADLRA
jgi:anti-sigma-K factor RskA